MRIPFLSSICQVVIFSLLFVSGHCDGQQSAEAKRTSEASEASALAMLKQIVLAEERYKGRPGFGFYGTLQDLAMARFVSLGELGYGVKYGYVFSSGKVGKDSFEIVALPVDLLETGQSGGSVLVANEGGVTVHSPAAWASLTKRRRAEEKETRVEETIQTLAMAEYLYQGTPGAGRLYGSLQQLHDANLIDPAEVPFVGWVMIGGSGLKDGYQFTIVLSADRARFEVFATPIEYGVSGLKSYYTSFEEFVVYAGDKKGARAGRSDTRLR